MSRVRVEVLTCQTWASEGIDDSWNGVAELTKLERISEQLNR